MIYDLRTYTCRPGTLKAHLGLYGKHGYPVQKLHLGEPLLYAVTETGPLNSFVHLWAYESAADRESRRTAMEADPDWIAYRRMSSDAGFLVAQENRLLSGPADFLVTDRP
jgi:hypothetical protein